MRTYKKKTDQKPLTQALYEQACRLINAGSSIRQASKAIGFSDTALRKRLKEGKGGSQLGRFRKVLSAAQEKDLVRHCVELDKRFFGLTLKSLRYLLYSYAKKNNIPCPFPDSSQMAGRDFTRMFMKRNRLSLRTPRKTSVARIMGFNRVQLTQYFENLEEALKKYTFLPERIYNMDETGVQTVPNKLLKHVAPVGKKEVAKSVSAEQGKTVTVVCAMSCVGNFVPPYFIFARKRENRLLIKGGPTGCDMAVTDKGYMNTATFLKWLAHFKRFTNPVPENPILIILDNHVSHISLAAVNFAKSNNIHLLTLPPHSSHKTQPLDRCFFRPFKAYYDAAADSWLTSRPGQTISEFEVAELVKIAFEKSATVEMAAQGFCSTGICPYDRNKFTDADFLPAEVSEQEPDEAEPQDSEDVDEQRFIVFDQEIVDPPLQALEPVVALEQDSPLQEHPAQIHMAIPLAEPSTSVSGSRDSEPSIASPEDIIPLPRIKIKRKRTGRGLKSVLITSTPHKEHLEEQERERTEKEKNKLARKTRKVLFPSAKPKQKRAKANPPTPISSSSDSDSSYSLHNSSSDFDDLNELFLYSEEDLEPAEQDERKLHQNDFSVVKVQGKTKNSMRLYVARILHVHIDGYDVLFYKRIPQSQRFSETIEEAFIESDDIFMSLSEPVKNTSGRFQNTITFGNDLSSFSIY